MLKTSMRTWLSSVTRTCGFAGVSVVLVTVIALLFSYLIVFLFACSCSRSCSCSFVLTFPVGLLEVVLCCTLLKEQQNYSLVTCVRGI